MDSSGIISPHGAVMQTVMQRRMRANVDWSPSTSDASKRQWDRLRATAAIAHEMLGASAGTIDSMIFSNDPSATPVTDPVVRSDSMASRNGLR